MSPKENRRQAGFTLLEAMVALAVAGLFLAALARTLATAWGTTPRPGESLSAVALARAVAAGEVGGSAGAAAGYRFTRTTSTVTFVERPSGLAPAPPAAVARQTPPSGGNSAILRGLTPPASPAPDVSDEAVAKNPILAGLTPPGQAARRPASLRPTVPRLLTVVVSTPTGRRVVWQTVRVGDAAP